MKRQELKKQAETITSLHKKYIPEYKRDCEALEAKLDRAHFLAKTEISETDNRRYDLPRLKYIVDIINFIFTYYVDKDFIFSTPPSVAEKEMHEMFVLMNERELLCRIGYLIVNLSAEVRSRYKTLLGPIPFTWETLECLGGLMKVEPSEQIAIIFTHPVETFIQEVLQQELIVEAAVNDILPDDLPILKSLILHIINELTSGPTEIFEPVNLLAIKALTTHVMDGKHLADLLCLTNNSYTEKELQDFKQVAANTAVEKTYQMIPSKMDKRQFDLTTKLGKHAALRRLQKIGELITGKNLSPRILKMDETTDWQALVAIRDAICHQDERAGKAIVDALLKDDERMLQLLTEVTEELFPRLNRLVMRRAEQIVSFRTDAEQFWHDAYAYEKHDLTKAPTVEIFKWRVTEEEAKFFLDTLKQRGAAPEIQSEWLRIFNGRDRIPPKDDYGKRFLKALPSKKTDTELYNKCKKIADKATASKTTLEEREEKRERQAHEAEKKIAEQKSKLTGLTRLRRLAFQFATYQNPLLSRTQRVEAAIEVLENIKEFMEQDKFIHANFNFPTIEAWNKAQPRHTAETFFARLLSNPELSEAIEYNAGQLLQYIRTICTYEETKAFHFIDSNSELLSSLRNYVEHGNHILDTERYEPRKEKSLVTRRQQTIGPTMVTLIFKLLPELKELSAQLKLHDVQQSFWLFWRKLSLTPPQKKPGEPGLGVKA